VSGPIGVNSTTALMAAGSLAASGLGTALGGEPGGVAAGLAYGVCTDYAEELGNSPIIHDNLVEAFEGIAAAGGGLLKWIRSLFD
jgi:hypothetical protein